MSEEDFNLSPIPGLAQMPGIGVPIIPESYSPEVILADPVLDDPPTKHPWMVSRKAPNSFSVLGGKVYGKDGSMVEITDAYTVDTNEEAQIWVKVTKNADQVTGAVFGHGAAVPDDTLTDVYRVVAALYFLPGDGDPYLCIEQFERNHIRLSADGAGNETNHPWKVTKGPQTDETGAREWLYTGDTVYSQNGSVAVPDGAVNAVSGTIYLRVERNETTRALVGVIVAVGTTVPNDDYIYQYVPIATVDDASADPPFQLAFEEIRIHELMIVENGAFKFAPFQLSSRTTYALPS